MNEHPPPCSPARLRLSFDAAIAAGAACRDLSTAARIGDALFVACDEGAAIERLRPDDTGWGRQDHFPIGDFFDLPGGREGGMDIEGLATDGDWLWVAGSQALKRQLPDPGHSPREGLNGLARTSFDENRQFLGRLPLVPGPGGLVPVIRDGDRRAAHVKFTRQGPLRNWLRDDPLIGPFVDLPGKENGLDIEGIAARGERVWLGLRGPVLHGYAVVLEMSMKLTHGGHLEPRRIEGRRRYRRHLLPLGGEGVRDLALDGDDLLILAGTPLAGDGGSAILRWRDAARVTGEGVRPAAEILLARRLPYRGSLDNPDGLTRWDGDRWLVVHDRPADWRLDPRSPAIMADLWALEG